jgi:pyruvate/2-oxoglutarate dehydrogenase complex dihydrolipoamide dehydrogenase (E3) component
MAGDSSVSPDYGPVAQRIRDEATDDWHDRVAVERLQGQGVHFIRGVGRLTGPGEVSVEDQVIQAGRAVVLATGTQPSIPPIPGLESTPYWTNRDAIEAKERPESLVVIGGGAIGLELAQAFARFGSAVTVLEAAPRILAVEEPQSSELLADLLPKDGITIRAAANISAVRHDGKQFTVVADGDDITGHELLVATGRRADLGSLGLDSADIDGSGRFLDVDDHLRVRDGVWAVGDVTGRGAFTHVATYQAAIAVRSILEQDGPGADYAALPRVTFTDPEIGAVGMTEEQARDAGHRVRIGITQLPESTRGMIHKAGNDGFIKLVEDADSGLLLGATSAGPAGGEVLGALAVAVHAGVPTSSLREMIFAYPTFHRAIEAALQALE